MRRPNGRTRRGFEKLIGHAASLLDLMGEQEQSDVVEYWDEVTRRRTERHHERLRNAAVRQKAAATERRQRASGMRQERLFVETGRVAPNGRRFRLLGSIAADRRAMLEGMEPGKWYSWPAIKRLVAAAGHEHRRNDLDWALRKGYLEKRFWRCQDNAWARRGGRKGGFRAAAPRADQQVQEATRADQQVQEATRADQQVQEGARADQQVQEGARAAAPRADQQVQEGARRDPQGGRNTVPEYGYKLADKLNVAGIDYRPQYAKAPPKVVTWAAWLE